MSDASGIGGYIKKNLEFLYYSFHNPPKLTIFKEKLKFHNTITTET